MENFSPQIMDRPQTKKQSKTKNPKRHTGFKQHNEEMQSNGYFDITKILTHISVSQEPIKKREATLSL